LKEKIYQIVSELEKQAALEADVLLSVTQADLDYFALTGSKAKLVLAPNASRPLIQEPHLGNSIISDLGLCRYALFIGSNHPPNVHGFLKILGDSLEYIHPDFQIVCVGGASIGILKHFDSLEDRTLPLSRVRLLVNLANNEIDQLRTEASVILLPILDGGGSNLKTAEALLSPTKILATTHSFRGFEAYSTSPGVYISKSTNDFRKVLAMISRSHKDEEVVRSQFDEQPLTWNGSLSKIDSELLREH
jgi:hypothetical protein